MNIESKRLDHLGIVAGIMKDLKIIEMIDERIPPDEQEEISAGEAVGGMILNGLGFSQRPISLTPQFFENKPLEILFRDGVEASHFNRFKLGRSLDDVFDYGASSMFSEIAASVCMNECIDLKFNSLDTSSFSLTGKYIPDTDEQGIRITHGYSKDHRPDLKQAVLELMVSQDGGVPTFSKCWNGNASDNKIFKERTAALIEQFKTGESPRYIILDSKGYTKDNSYNLKFIPFITRAPKSLKAENTIVKQALHFEQWQPINDDYRIQSFELGHYGIEQRWIVVWSDGAFERAKITLEKRVKKERKAIEKQLFHLQAKRFTKEALAVKELEKFVQGWKYHQVDEITLKQHISYSQKGRPSADTPKSIKWQICATLKLDQVRLKREKCHKACFVLATSIPKEELTDEAVFWAYKEQSHVERGFRFFKEPVFFVSSLFLKKPSRIEGLLMVMTLALLVYSVAQRRMRNELKRLEQTLPNQINQPTNKPTLRWIFQLLEGIDYIKIEAQEETQTIINGITDISKNIFTLFGKTVAQIYQINST